MLYKCLFNKTCKLLCFFLYLIKKLIARFSELNSDSNELKEEVEIVQKRVEENDRLLKVG